MLVFAMAGASSRFSKAGYDKPKFMLPLGQYFCFDYAVAGLARAFEHEEILFVVRDGRAVSSFVEDRCRALGIDDFRITALDRLTCGQAETVLLGLKTGNHNCNDELTIFNIDTFHLDFSRPERSARGDGYLEVFHGSGDNWSFAKADPSGRVLQTAEKRPISNLCSTGLYHFRRAEDFMEACEASLAGANQNSSERYVAPLYNRLVERGLNIRVHVIARDEIVFSGIPAEYEDVANNPATLSALAANVERLAS